jgi:alkane 1-monooxygenase
MFWYAIASLTPAVALAVGAVRGGLWSYVAMLYIAVFVLVMDRWTRVELRELSEEVARPVAQRLLLALGCAHLGLLLVGISVIAQAQLSWASIAMVLGLGLFMGQVSHPNAHELIHCPGRGLRFLGAAVYSSMLFGHHVSAHLKVHHVHVATDEDPNSPKIDEGFYRFALRAWGGSFIAGLRAENRDRGRRGVKLPIWRHPYVGYIGGSLAILAYAYIVAGMRGIWVLLVVCAHAQLQILMADYVQHYGLRRKPVNGRMEPVGPQHSWNAPHWFSSAMMLNAPRHSDHHMHPKRSFPALRLDPEVMPVLPRSMPVMAALALVPPVWRRVMDRRARVWRAREVAE